MVPSMPLEQDAWGGSSTLLCPSNTLQVPQLPKLCHLHWQRGWP